MKHISLARPLTIALITAFSLAACSKGADPAALEASDAALKGVSTEGALAPVSARTVRVGLNGKDKAACGAVATIASPTDVRWSNSAEGPAKAQVSGEVAPCEIDGGWTGIVFPAVGQSLDECGVDGAVRDEREYQGPCRWGWVESSKLSPSAV